MLPVIHDVPATEDALLSSVKALLPPHAWTALHDAVRVQARAAVFQELEEQHDQALDDAYARGRAAGLSQGRDEAALLLSDAQAEQEASLERFRRRARDDARAAVVDEFSDVHARLRAEASAAAVLRDALTALVAVVLPLGKPVALGRLATVLRLPQETVLDLDALSAAGAPLGWHVTTTAAASGQLACLCRVDGQEVPVARLRREALVPAQEDVPLALPPAHSDMNAAVLAD